MPRALVPGAGGRPRAGPPASSAAASHHANDAYMADFDRGHAALFGSGAAPAAFSSVTGSLGRKRLPQSPGSPPAASASLSSSSSSSPPFSLSAAASAPSLPPPPPQFATTAQWRRGPRDPAGRVADLSDRPIMCMAVAPPYGQAAAAEVACGGSDHAVYGVDVRRGDKSRTLHGGRFGHSEWVTAVSYLGDGSSRVISAGMEGKICVWASRPAGRHFPCTDLLGHFGSVSGIASPGGGSAACGPPSARFGGLVVSCGYDRTVRLWEAASGRAAFESPKAHHSAPVLGLALLAKDGAGELLAATGDRDGVACVWRLHEGVCAGALRGHRGHLTAVAWLPADAASTSAGGALSAASSAGSADLVVTGAQDGHVRVWDLRSPACVANVGCHASEGGSGAVGDISVARVGPAAADSSASASSYSSPALGSESVIVSSGADRRICVLDPRTGFSVRSAFTEHRDFIYSLTTAGSLCFSGGGDGMLIAHDLSEGRPLWAVGAGLAAVRCVGVVGSSHLAASGDDGKCIVYEF